MQRQLLSLIATYLVKNQGGCGGGMTRVGEQVEKRVMNEDEMKEEEEKWFENYPRYF